PGFTTAELYILSVALVLAFRRTGVTRYAYSVEPGLSSSNKFEATKWLAKRKCTVKVSKIKKGSNILFKPFFYRNLDIILIFLLLPFLLQKF
ncbi:hypothetical protein, partial [Empedobacter brevis]|uniref:hypothetical protein n=1 Tax=Empedobacter brevis TaxID=247 RepID=UPI003340C10E